MPGIQSKGIMRASIFITIIFEYGDIGRMQTEHK